MTRSSAPSCWGSSVFSRFELAGDGWTVGWTSVGPPYLYGTPAVVAAARLMLAQQDYIMLTPTGPAVPADEADPLAVLGAVAATAGPSTLTAGTLPQIPGPRPPTDAAVY